MKIVFGSDHVGVALKCAIMSHVKECGHEVYDVGAYSTERTDYPIYGSKAATLVSDGSFQRGIVICGTGVGISIAANKVFGIRCACVSEPYSAKLSRQHNDSNMLALGSRVVGTDLAMMIVDEWLSAEYEGGRHASRIAQIGTIERAKHL
ncbi:ribose 5-phosphate isomerase B [Acidipropionibacterium timonense]|uniref:ribose 5-phosphate isomerase B n=1 Tax=Acidipropionibacterium timonense TaxID=2161818 RepID=UPI001030DA63|nr:ribose 5-phosphate isomerase B [Acidipropionibacterium timonense]